VSTESKTLLNSKALNGWGLFGLVCLPISILIIIEMTGTDLSAGDGISHMIRFSVRFAIPFIYLAMAASSIRILFPGAFSTWWLRNRKYIGMCFAMAMAWQGAFIAVVSVFFRDYYYEDIYYLRDEIEGSVGYIFLTAMLVASFALGREYLSAKQWKVIHKSGLYFLWAYAFSVYWWKLIYYENTELIDYLFYWGGFAAFASRIAAWGMQRLQAARKHSPGSHIPLPFRVMGNALIALGLVVSMTGLAWQDAVTTFLTAPKWSAALELWLPYWPFEPYLSLFMIGLGTLLITRSRA